MLLSAQVARRAEVVGEDVEAEVAALTLTWKREAALRDLAAAPRSAISDNAAYFDLLFSLLSSPSQAVVADAWALIQALPVNEAVSVGIKTLQGALEGGDAASASSTSAAAVDWDALLDPSAPLKLLYSLQILAKHLDGLEAPTRSAIEASDVGTPGAAAVAGADAALNSEWARAFVRLGGVSHLASVILKVDLNALLPAATAATSGGSDAGSLTLHCLQLLLRSFSRFSVVATDEGENVGVGGWRAFSEATAGPLLRPLMVRRMLEVLASVAAISLPSATTEGAPPPPAPLALARSTSSASAKSGSMSPSKQQRAARSGDDKGGARALDDDEADFASPAPEAAATKNEGGGDAPESPLVAIVRHAIAEILTAALLGPVVAATPDASNAAALEHAAGPAALEALTSFPDFGTLLSASLLAPPEMKVRMTVAMALSRMSVAEATGVADPAGPLPLTGFILEALISHVRVAYALPQHGTLPFFFIIERLLSVRGQAHHARVTPTFTLPPLAAALCRQTSRAAACLRGCGDAPRARGGAQGAPCRRGRQ